MNFLFRKKQTLQALAELLEDGREIMNEEMKKLKYNNYEGQEVFVEIAVRVQPENEPPFEANMKASLLKAYLLTPGVHVRVQYDPAKKGAVDLDDEPAAILERNPQLKK